MGLKITEKSVDELIPYENNPRRNDDAVEDVANSIREFGFKNPILLDENNVIIAGHTRLKAAKKLGINKVPCIYCNDLTEEQVKAFRLADNKTAEKAGWDFDMLNEELKDINDIDMSEFGFDLGELDLDIDGMFQEAEPKEDTPESKTHMIKCPHCGENIELDEDFNVMV
jgi:ParB family chromosome partitioning protein